MKSLKSLFAALTLVAVTFACASVTETPAVSQAPQVDEPTITVDQAVFNSGDNQKPILTKPKI